MAQPLQLSSSAPFAWLEHVVTGRAIPGRSPIGSIEAACFEAHPDPQFVFNDEAEVVFSNRAARAFLDSVAGPRALAETLVAEAGDFMHAVHRAIRVAIGERRASAPIALALAPPLAFTLRVVPLGVGHPYALATMSLREQVAQRSQRERFGFTASESRVAEALCRGRTPAEIARALGVSVETVRCHLKQAFAKAGVRRQAELVAVLLSD